MPFRQAHWGIVALLVISGFAFWQSWLSALADAPWAWHLHGITATLWIAFVGLQGWSGSTRRFAFHRAIGRASLILFPLFFAGGIAVVHRMASLTPEELFYRLHGYGLGVFDLAASITIAWAWYCALRDRRTVQRHARFMLATPLLLLGPAFSRILTHYVPGLIIHGPEEFGLFVYSVHLSDLLTAVIAFWLFGTNPRYGLPFLVVGMVAIVQSAGFAVLPEIALWRDAFEGFGQLPIAPVLVASLAAGTAVTWLGWTAGQRPLRGPATAAA